MMDEIKLAFQECYTYDPETGAIINKKARKGIFVGMRAGHTSKYGYVRIGVRVNGRFIRVPAHRVAWMLHYGEWPSGQIDHINFDKADNRIGNLRVVTASTNNAVRPLKKREFPRGVTYTPRERDRPYRASIRDYVKGKVWYIGQYKTPDEAARAYIDAFISLHGEPPPPCKPKQSHEVDALVRGVELKGRYTVETPPARKIEWR